MLCWWYVVSSIIYHWSKAFLKNFTYITCEKIVSNSLLLFNFSHYLFHPLCCSSRILFLLCFPWIFYFWHCQSLLKWSRPIHQSSMLMLMGQCKKEVALLLTHWSYPLAHRYHGLLRDTMHIKNDKHIACFFLALVHRYHGLLRDTVHIKNDKHIVCIPLHFMVCHISSISFRITSLALMIIWLPQYQGSSPERDCITHPMNLQSQGITQPQQSKATQNTSRVSCWKGPICHAYVWSGVYTKFSGRLSEEPFPWLIQKFLCILIFKIGQPGCQLNLSEGQIRLDLTSKQPLV